MITYLEGVLLRDASGTVSVVSIDAQGHATGSVPIPAMMHPLAARGVGRRYEELERHACLGAQVVITVETDSQDYILEIDEIEPASPADIAAARAFLSTRRLAA